MGKNSYLRKNSSGKFGGLNANQSDFRETVTNVNESATQEFSLGGDGITSRSIVKSALAGAFDAGLSPKDCELALEYLTASDKTSGPYKAISLPHSYPAHLVAVLGIPESNELTATVVYFGVIGFQVELSKEYQGERLEYKYMVDPIKGRDVL